MTENMTPELTLTPTETETAAAVPELTLEPTAAEQVEEKKIEPVELDDKLLTEQERADGYYLRLNIMAMLRGDNESRSRYYEKMIALGIYSQDDCRTLEDRSPLPGGLGKSYWMSKNYDRIENFGGENV